MIVILKRKAYSKESIKVDIFNLSPIHRSNLDLILLDSFDMVPNVNLIQNIDPDLGLIAHQWVYSIHIYVIFK